MNPIEAETPDATAVATSSVRSGVTSPRQRKNLGDNGRCMSVAQVYREAVQEVEKRVEAYRDVVAEEFEKLEKRAEHCRDVAVEELEKLEKRAEHIRDVVVEEFEKWSVWAYKDIGGEEWDAQPACFITDYLLAVQCFGFALYITLFATDSETSNPWYLIYFVALGTSAAFGGVLHHVAFEALQAFADAKKKDLVKTTTVFGYDLSRKTVDNLIEIMWRIVLGSSILSNFALLSLAASRHLSEAWAYTMIFGAGACYVALAIWASINMNTVFLMAGFVPAMVFGAVASVMTLTWEWGHSTNELLVYVLKLGSGLVQGLVVSPSMHKFNHNALSHVILSVAATFVLVHCRL